MAAVPWIARPESRTVAGRSTCSIGWRPHQHHQRCPVAARRLDSVRSNALFLAGAAAMGSRPPGVADLEPNPAP